MIITTLSSVYICNFDTKGAPCECFFCNTRPKISVQKHKAQDTFVKKVVLCKCAEKPPLFWFNLYECVHKPD